MSKPRPYFEIHADHGTCAVPDFVMDAVLEAKAEADEANYDMLLRPHVLRDEVARLIAPKMVTPDGADWRFCSCYRHAGSGVMALIYQIVNTVQANYEAGKLEATHAD